MSHSYDHALRDLVARVGEVYELTYEEMDALTDALRPPLSKVCERALDRMAIADLYEGGPA